MPSTLPSKRLRRRCSDLDVRALGMASQRLNDTAQQGGRRAHRSSPQGDGRNLTKKGKKQAKDHSKSLDLIVLSFISATLSSHMIARCLSRAPEVLDDLLHVIPLVIAQADVLTLRRPKHPLFKVFEVHFKSRNPEGHLGKGDFWPSERPQPPKSNAKRVIPRCRTCTTPRFQHPKRVFCLHSGRIAARKGLWHRF